MNIPDHWRFFGFKVYYRLCDKQAKINIPLFTWKTCLTNFITHYGTKDLHIICDNCEDSTIEFVKSKVSPTSLEVTNLGNSPSFNYMIDRILKECKDTDVVYLVESDYLHTPNIKYNILDGLNFGEYVTLYDHPDFYKNYSPNITVKNGTTKCVLNCGALSHWRSVPGTTMTFATHVLTLRDDYEKIIKHTKSSPPSDCEMFLEITRYKKLVSPIPSKSTHGAINCISKFVDWDTEIRNAHYQ